MGKQKKHNASSQKVQSSNDPKMPHLEKCAKSSPPPLVQILIPSAVYASVNFLSPGECKALINFAECEGFEQLSSPQTSVYAHRECGRISRTSFQMADELFLRMKFMVERIMKDVQFSKDEHYKPISCNSNIRIYKYEKGMSFGRHFDGSEKISHYAGGNTEITVLIYLSSCSGGSTRFYLPKRGKKKNNEGSIAFQPQEGALLMHLHGDRCLEHEADPVQHGIKYVLRTDIVFARCNE